MEILTDLCIFGDIMNTIYLIPQYPISRESITTKIRYLVIKYCILAIINQVKQMIA